MERNTAGPRKANFASSTHPTLPTRPSRQLNCPPRSRCRRARTNPSGRGPKGSSLRARPPLAKGIHRSHDGRMAEQLAWFLTTIWPWVIGVVHVVVTLFASGHVVLNKRDARSAIGWVGIIWLT